MKCPCSENTTNMIIFQQHVNSFTEPYWVSSDQNQQKYNWMKKVFVFILFALCLFDKLDGQITKIKGFVNDSTNGDPLVFVNISLQGTTVGTVSNDDGSFSIETSAKSEILVVSYVGYQTKKIKVKRNSYQEIKVQLVPEVVKLTEVVVRPGVNPAHPIFNQVVKNKPWNDLRKQTSYHYKSYNKVQIDLNNIDEQFKQQRVFRQFQFVFDNVDTNALTGKVYLPVLISETLSDVYYQREPYKEKEVILASNMSGIRNQSVTQLTGRMTQSVNIYDNYMYFFDGGFISPISDFGLLYYKYYLVDSAMRDGKWCYRLSFKPIRKQDRAFSGEMWVVDTAFAVKSITMRLSKEANVNFINELQTTFVYSEANPGIWALNEEEILVDFNLVEGTETLKGFFGRKTGNYSAYQINTPIDNEIAELKTSTVISDSALDRDAMFWANNRPTQLSDKEKKIYQMVDSIKNVPLYQTLADWVNLFVNYYYVVGLFEFGPYFNSYSFNPLEGQRFRIGGRTSNAFSTRQMFSGYVAYGTRDEKVKFGLGYTRIIRKLPRISIGANYNDDVEQLGKSPNAFTQDNILSSILRRNPNDKLTPYKRLQLNFEKEWYQGFSNTLYFKQSFLYPSEFIRFEKLLSNNDLSQIKRIVTTEFVIKTHFAWNERFLLGEFERVSLGTEYPVVDFYMTTGIRDNEKPYYKTQLQINHFFETNPLGYFKYTLDAGKIFGTLPFPLLELHRGNETYAFDYYAFNMMNYYEFVSDQYVSLFAEQHFQGYFLNNIPLLRKLKWREVATIKGLMGTLEDKNNGVFTFPGTLGTLGKPYWETSVGIENIFKIIRIDAMWRLSHLDHPNISPFGLRAKLQIVF